MSHMVIYRGPDGKPGYHQTDEIHDAVGFVEKLKNEQDVEHARIFRLEEVEFSYRPYFRVELGDLPAVAAAPVSAAVSAPVETAAPAVSTPAVVAPAVAIPSVSAPSVSTPAAPEAPAASTPVAEEAPAEESTPEPAAEPTITAPGSTSSPDSGLGARRGLFGR